MAASPSLRPRRFPIRPRPLGILGAAIIVTAAGAVAGWAGLGGRLSSTNPRAAALHSSPASIGVVAPGPDADPVAIPGTGVAYPAAGSLALLDHNIGLWTRNLQADPQDRSEERRVGKECRL